MNLDDLHKVWETKVLKKPQQDEAKILLEKIAQQVQPILRKHKWRVKLLSEFCPKNPSLLGLNVGGGVHVKLRLRRPNNDWGFFPFDQILDTMLHELCHNVHGPHNAEFYKLWDDLRKECEELLSKGITGSGFGFDLPGRKLGGFSRQIPLSSLRKTALNAAEKRAKLASLLPTGPKRLGSSNSTVMTELSPMQAAAMAAERRLMDAVWCGSQPNCVDEDGDDKGSGLVENSHDGRKRKYEPNSSMISPHSLDHLKLVVDLTSNDSPSESSKRTCNSNSDASDNMVDSAEWECPTCTLLNPPLAPVCELCDTRNRRDMDAKHKSWKCKFCTLENSCALHKCSACDQWRYSSGPPASTRTPYLGT